MNRITLPILFWAMGSIAACSSSGYSAPLMQNEGLALSSSKSSTSMQVSPSIDEGVGSAHWVFLDTERAELKETLTGIVRGTNRWLFIPPPELFSKIEVLSVTAFMPAHGHGTDPIRIARRDRSFLLYDMQLYMSGWWEIRIVFRIDGGEEEEIVLGVSVG